MCPARFEEEMPHEVGFAEIYDRDIVPNLKKINEDRLQVVEKSKKRKKISILILGTAFACSVAYLLLGLDYTSEEVLPIWGFINLFIAIFAVVAAVIFTRWPLIKFKDKLKDFLVGIACGFFGDVSFAREGADTVDLKRFHELDLVENFTSETQSDALRGEIDGTAFRWAEAEAEYTSRSSGSKSASDTRTVFSGCLLAVTVSEPFHGDVRIRSGRFLPDAHRVDIGHPAFHDRFKVFAEDETEARRLITHEFADKMLAVARQYDSGRINGAFHDGEFLLAIETDIDRFEQVDADTPPEEIPAVMHHFLADIQHVRELVRGIAY